MANPNRRVKTTEGWLYVGDRVAKVTDGGGLATLPLIDGTAYKTKPESPLYFDAAPHLRSIHIDNPDGIINVRFWRSLTSDDPANLTAIEAAITAGDPVPQPDMTGMKWILLTGLEYGIPFQLGLHLVPQWLLDAARLGRWLKVDPIYGSFLNTNFYPLVTAG